MSVIDEVFASPAAQWINRKIVGLPLHASVRASNAVRALIWANRIADTPDVGDVSMQIPATYCALHATEEAAAAFIRSAQVLGYEGADRLSIKTHKSKAITSLIAQQMSNILNAEVSPAISVHEDSDTLVARWKDSDEFSYGLATLSGSFFQNGDGSAKQGFTEEILQRIGDPAVLADLVHRGHQARIRIFYADDDGLPTGFDEPDVALRREAGITLGLIWATIDLNNYPDEKIPFYQQAIATANQIAQEYGRPRR